MVTIKHGDTEEWKVLEQGKLLEALYMKYTFHPHLRRLLLSTGTTTLFYANMYDREWSCGFALDNPLVFEPESHLGRNLLGHCLMYIRDLIAKEDSRTLPRWP
jgi:predicted NAD-dependent protein-ADP-ribosyltransferase YbiA (DUF1768 family)